MIAQEWIEYGTSFGILYGFEHRGEGLPMHSHEPETVHNLIVLEGVVRVRSETQAFFYGAGEIVNDLPMPHEIVALSERTVILSLFREGKPELYKTLPESERKTSYESRLKEYL